MALKITALLAALVVGAAPVASDEPGPESLEKQFSKALGLTLSKLEQVSGPLRDARADVAKVTDTTARDLDGAVYWTSSIPHPGDHEKSIKVFLCQIPMGRADIGESLVICTDYTGVMVNGAVLDEKNVLKKEWNSLLSQRVGRPIPRLERVRPVSHLERYEKLKKDGTKDERVAGGLVSLRRLMVGHVARAQWMMGGLEHGEKPKAKEIEQLVKAFNDVAALEKPLKGFLGVAGEEFVANAKLAAERTRALSQIKIDTDEQIEAAKGAMEQLGESCQSCHKLTSPSFHGPLMRAAGHRRSELGLSDGFYLVGYDLQGETDHERDQHVATRMKRAHLLLDRIIKR